MPGRAPRAFSPTSPKMIFPFGGILAWSGEVDPKVEKY
jgi:hypothetical protein